MSPRLQEVTFGMLDASCRLMTTSPVSKLTNADLMARLQKTRFASNRLLAEIVVLLIEVEARRLHLSSAYPSLFEFCLKELHLSEGEAYRRINAVKLVKRFPGLLAHIEQGSIHLSALLQLRDHFTEENVDELVASTTGKNKMYIAELVARLAPRPDVPAKLRKLPQHDRGSRMTTKATRPSIDPLSEARYRLQLTGSRRFRDKLLHARDLLMHTNPSGDLAVVVERALDELIDTLEKRVYGKLSRKPANTAGELMSDDEVVVPVAARPAKTTTLSNGRVGRRPGLARASADARGGVESARIRERKASSAPDKPTHLRQRKLGSSRRAYS